MRPITVCAAILASLMLMSALPASAIAAPPSPGPLSLSINSPSTREGNSGTKTMTFKVSLSTRPASTVTVDYRSYDGSAISVANGLDPADYIAVQGTLSFAPGEKSKTITVQIVGDKRIEADETFVVLLSNPTGAIIADGQGIGTIINDDR